MINEINDSLQEVTWDVVRDDVRAVNPELADAIDQLSPSAEYTLFKARYPYGQLILDRGMPIVPLGKGNYEYLHSSMVNKTVQQKLLYAPTIPLGMVLNKSIELYVTDNEEQPIPMIVMKPGSLFAITSALNPYYAPDEEGVWSISAGARSIFMLSKISDKNNHALLQDEFHITSFAPQKLGDQWSTFKELAPKISKTRPWHVDLLFFTNKWTFAFDEKKQKMFKYFFYESYWKKMYYWRNKYIYDFVLSKAQHKNDNCINPYISSTCNHLIALAAKAFPGFAVATTNQQAPIHNLQKVYNEIYKLNHAPIFMTPNYAAKDTNIYYSLNYQTRMDCSTSSIKKITRIEALRTLKHNMDKMLLSLKNSRNRKKVYGFSLFNLIANTYFEYFHKDTDNLKNIKSINEIIQTDRNLILEMKKFNGKTISPSSAFFCGCIKILANYPDG